MRLWLALLLVLALGGQARAADRWALVDVTVIDGTGSAADPHRTILIEGERIVAVTSARRRLPAGVRRVQGRGLTVIPGLWDMHVHTLAGADMPPVFLPRFVAWGVTTVRDMGGDEAGWASARAFMAKRPDWTPRIYRPGRILDGPKPVQADVSIAVSTPDEARAAVDRMAGEGADFIKVYTLLPPDAFRAVVAEARLRGLRVAGHLPFGVSVEDAIAAPMLSIEHMVAETGGLCPADQPSACAPIFARLAEARLAQTPTLDVLSHGAQAADHPEWALDPELKLMPPAVRADWLDELERRRTAPSATKERRKAAWAHDLWMAKGLIAAHVPVLAGTDTGTLFVYPGRSLHEELALLVEAGLSPLQAISAASWRAATLMGAGDRSGRIAPGFAADLVLLSADPSRNIANTRRIRAVVKSGRLHDRRALDRVLRGEP